MNCQHKNLSVAMHFFFNVEEEALHTIVVYSIHNIPSSLFFFPICFKFSFFTFILENLNEGHV